MHTLARFDPSSNLVCVAGADGTLYLIDFGPPHCREMKRGDATDANMDSLGFLLWSADRGLLRRGWVSEEPALAVARGVGVLLEQPELLSRVAAA